jgi:hypothetical protein
MVSGPTFLSSSSAETLLRIRPWDHSSSVLSPWSTRITALSVPLSLLCKRDESSFSSERRRVSLGERGWRWIGSRGSPEGHSGAKLFGTVRGYLNNEIPIRIPATT